MPDNVESADSAGAPGKSSPVLSSQPEVPEEYPLVTPCHKPIDVIERNQCKDCGGNTNLPIGTSVYLPCDHWGIVNHISGDRLVQCRQCESKIVVRAQKTIAVRYTCSPLPL